MPALLETSSDPLGPDPLGNALLLHRAGRLAEAETAYRSLVAADPQNGAALSLLGSLLLRGGRAGEAVPFLSTAVACDPDDPELALAHANALLRAGRPVDAAVAYRALVERWPGKAAAWSNLAEALRAAGSPDASLVAADQALILAPELAEAQLGRGNALLALDRAAEAEAAFARALEAKPGLAAAEIGRAAALLRLRRAEEASAAAERAASGAPNSAEAHFVLGCARRERGDAGAIDAFATAARLDPQHARAWQNLGNALVDADRAPEAETAYARAIELDPDSAAAYSGLGCALTAGGRIEPAIAAFDRALALRPDFAEAHWNQGFARLLVGDYANGWEQYEWRKRYDRFASTFPTLVGPAWEGEPLSGRRLLVYAEQGLGDALQFARYLPLLASEGARPILACDRRLVALLETLGPSVEIVPKDAPLPPYDFWVDQMSLPRLFATRADTIPAAGGYLAAPQARTDAWRTKLPPGPKVGLVWAGNPEHSNDRRRSVPVETMRPVADLPGIRFVSLQVGPRAADVARFGGGLVDVAPDLRDFADTAAVLANLDLLIAVDTSAAHLAGSLGVPVWILIPHAPDWRWLTGRDDTPWYGSARLFRQSAPGDWDGVISRVKETLATYFGV
jgi:tetratricopeptide (TPR) repeat protein